MYEVSDRDGMGAKARLATAPHNQRFEKRPTPNQPQEEAP